jgi:hypothetical protein
MAKPSDPAKVGPDEPWLVLTQALADLESQALTRARELMATETKTLKDRIAAIESALKKDRSAATPHDTAKSLPAKPAAPVQQSGPVETPVRPHKKAMPSLPVRLSIASLEKYLAGLGFQIVDNRKAGGSVWVFHGEKEFGLVAEHLKHHGIGVQRYPHGRRRRTGDQYEIDPYKVLPDR